MRGPRGTAYAFQHTASKSLRSYTIRVSQCHKNNLNFVSECCPHSAYLAAMTLNFDLKPISALLMLGFFATIDKLGMAPSPYWVTADPAAHNTIGKAQSSFTKRVKAVDNKEADDFTALEVLPQATPTPLCYSFAFLCSCVSPRTGRAQTLYFVHD